MTADAQLFRYQQPAFESGKRMVKLVKTDRMMGFIQVVKTGGETNLHSHAHLDGLWMVLSGRARFYGDVTTVIADLGKYEGIFLPRGFKYWFESAGDEPLEIIQVEVSDVDISAMKEERTDYTPSKRMGLEAIGSDGQTGTVPAR